MPYIGKSPSAGVRQRYQYTATAGQTTFTGTDLGNLTLTYTDNNFVDVFQNGVLLKGGTTDYTATSGTSVVLTTGASVSDVIEIIVYDVFSVGNFYSRTDSDSRFVNHDSGTLGTDNFIAGNNAGDAITSGGNYNTLVGNEAGTAITTGDRNTAVGFEALKTATTAQYNVAVGYQALENNTGNNNTAVGDQALEANTSGTNNTAVGDDAAVANTTGIRNVAIGNNALATNQEGDQSVAVGYNALQAQNPSGNADMNNTAVGNDAGYATTTGTQNTYVGASAGAAVTTAINNVLIGGVAGDALTTGSDNVAIGKDALGGEDTGRRCVAVGFKALHVQNADEDMRNTAVGYKAGISVSTGYENTLIGGNAGDTITEGLRNTIIGNDADCNASADDTIVIGATAVSVSDGYITMGRGSGSNRISNLPTANASWAHSSDERFKKDITTNTDCGLDFINELRTVTYKWKAPSELDNSFSSYDKDKTEASYANKIYGLIAQEVKSAMDKHSITNFDGWSELGDEKIQNISEAMFVFPLIKAVQELSAKNDALEARIKKLEDG